MGAKIAIFGAGQSGQAVRRLAQSLGHASVLFDESGQGDADSFSQADLARFDTFVFSPGFAADHPWRRLAAGAGRPCLSELAYAAPHWRGPLIGITGTNGKTTLTQLLADALAEVRRKEVVANVACPLADASVAPSPMQALASEHATLQALALGNIGYPLADAVRSPANKKGACAVVEISSFQAELSQSLRLDGLLWTNFAEDHLDRYTSMDAYFEAKAQLFECLKPGAHCVVGRSVLPYMERRVGSCAECHPADPDTALLAELQADSVFRRRPNIENFNLAAAWWTRSGLPVDALIQAADAFKPAPHRLTPVAECGDVRFWNDSKATNFLAALAAVESVAPPIVWIGGGRAKGGDLPSFARSIAARVDVAVLYGEVAEALAAAMHGQPVRVVRFDKFSDAVQAAAILGGEMPGANVVLSPGFASFDQFDAYSARGKMFSDMVLGLKNARRPR
ncbi:MAG: hypothetical protein GVY36_07820 [Verrucomicrobia bacterium]|jgi:UDP-N-acetylmuramoylalanine--D-glutamate ligase|nr:hypothetical protein [Verrucomicrobiota bacterium]